MADELITKVLVDRTDRVHNRLVNNKTGGIVSQAYANLRSTASTSAGRHRVKPSKANLRTTFLAFNSVELNANEYSTVLSATTQIGTCDFALTGLRFSRPLTSTSNDQIAEAYARATSKFSGDDINLGETLIDLKSTSSMILKRIGDVVAFGNALRKADVNKLKSLLKGEFSNKQAKELKALPQSKRVANTWLEYQYGWSPLINDIYSGIEFLNKGSDEVGARVYRRSGQIQRGYADRPNLDSRKYFGQIHAPQAQVSIQARVVNKRVRDLQRLGLANPAQIAWNAMPLSFVADWLIPVGSILGSLTWDAGLKVESITLVRESVGESGRAGVTFRKSRSVTRDRLANQPNFLAISYGLLLKEVRFSVNKAITSTALVRQLLVR